MFNSSKCSINFEFVSNQERAAGALANLAADDKCSMEVALAGGVHALVMLARNCKSEGVQEQVCYFLLLGDLLRGKKVHTKICKGDTNHFSIAWRLHV